MQINPYLIFDGNCEEAFKFYAQLLRGTIEAMMTHEGTPACDQVPAEAKHKIMHARLNASGQILMASDALPGHFQKPQGFSVSINVAGAAEAERIFAGLAQGGHTIMPIGETFWAERFGMCVDRFGTPWMVNCQKPE